MTDYSAIAKLLAQEASSQLGDKEPRYWQWGTTAVPREQYRKCVFLVVGDYSPAVLKAMPKSFEGMAKNAGFRLLKVQSITSAPIELGAGWKGHLFTGYAASDTVEQPVESLTKALQGAPLVIDSKPVGLVEKSALDALWVAGGAITKPKVKHDVVVDVWPIVGGAAAILVVATLLWATVRKVK